MKYNKIKINLAKKIQKLLTLCLNCAKLVLGYTGIVVYFFGQKSQPLSGELDQKNKKQNKKAKIAEISNFASNLPITGPASPAVTQGGLSQSGNNVSNHVILAEKSNSFSYYAFCFLSKRFFIAKRFGIKKSALYCPTNKKQKEQKHDSWLLSVTRHFKANRPEQNYADPLGRSGINSPSFARQSGLALLQPRPSQTDYSVSQRNQLFPEWSWFLPGKTRLKKNGSWQFNVDCQFESSLNLLSFLLFSICPYVLAETKIKYFYRLADYSNQILVYSVRRQIQTGWIN